MLLRSTLAALALGTAVYAVAVGSTERVTTRDIAIFPNGTWVENINILSNGQLLVTLLNVPELYQVDPRGIQEPRLVKRISGVEGLLGIAEVTPDVFAVIAGNLSLATDVSTAGSYSIWKIDARSYPAKSSKIADIPKGILLNGMTLLDKEGTVLIADSGAGVVYSVNANTGKYQVVLDDPSMKPAAGAAIQIGINGLHTHNGFLYFTSTTQGLFARVPIKADGTALGPVQVIARPGSVDDFTFDAAGSAYVATNSGNTLLKITAQGAVTTVAGNADSTTLAGATSAHFGVGSEKSVLYVTLDGRFTNAAGQTSIRDGKVVGISGLV
ncbi:hypothetical protein HWV62_31686 [Athelia sp. TMB]|nr:hypothetical protein HWV62_31686 [Athelia sp. TMB]